MRKVIAVVLLGATVVACTPKDTASPQSTGYNRNDWGDWSQHGDGCDTRELILKRDGTNVKADPQCRAISGSWYSQYDGKTITISRQVQIDHIVPVKEAWRSGGADWPSNKKNQFYNDTDNLIAVSANSNESKSDQDPATWIPPRKEFDCVYVQRYELVKKRWNLTEDPKEQAAIANVKTHC